MASGLSAPGLRVRKQSGDPLVMVTAYDAPGARIADAAGVDLILVGDSVANTVLGYDDTLQVTVDDMVHHISAVARANPTPLIVGDLPWLSYHTARLIRAGAGVVKLEGGRKRLPVIEALVDAEIPVMGHLGLTPQSVHAMGGYRVQAKDAAAAVELIADADALANAGCCAMVLEGVPDEVARIITERILVPTIGIGAGPWCDGQVLVFHDVLGLEDRIAPKFVRRYATLKADAVHALAEWAADVRGHQFPSDAETYHLSHDASWQLAMTFGPRPTDTFGPRSGDSVGPRAGDSVGPRAGDSVAR
jgi:3-methyl-2-oxobutanoate hydroxymethyltransferase